MSNFNKRLFLIRIDEDYKIFYADSTISTGSIEKSLQYAYKNNDYDIELLEIGPCMLNLQNVEYVGNYGFIDMDYTASPESKLWYFDFRLNVPDSKITNLNPEIASNEKLDIDKFKESLIALGEKSQEYLAIVSQLMGKKNIHSDDLQCQSHRGCENQDCREETTGVAQPLYDSMRNKDSGYISIHEKAKTPIIFNIPTRSVANLQLRSETNVDTLNYDIHNRPKPVTMKKPSIPAGSDESHGHMFCRADFSDMGATGESYDPSSEGATTYVTYNIFMNNYFSTGFLLEETLNLDLNIFGELCQLKSIKLPYAQYEKLHDLLTGKYFTSNEKLVKFIDEKVKEFNESSKTNKSEPVKLSMSELIKHISLHFDLSNEISNRIKFSNLHKMIVNFYGFSKEETKKSRHMLPCVLKEMGLSKKRYSDGMYWYGIKQKDSANYTLKSSKNELHDLTPSFSTIGKYIPKPSSKICFSNKTSVEGFAADSMLCPAEFCDDLKISETPIKNIKLSTHPIPIKTPSELHHKMLLPPEIQEGYNDMIEYNTIDLEKMMPGKWIQSSVGPDPVLTESNKKEPLINTNQIAQINRLMEDYKTIGQSPKITQERDQLDKNMKMVKQQHDAHSEILEKGPEPNFNMIYDPVDVEKTYNSMSHSDTSNLTAYDASGTFGYESVEPSTKTKQTIKTPLTIKSSSLIEKVNEIKKQHLQLSQEQLSKILETASKKISKKISKKEEIQTILSEIAQNGIAQNGITQNGITQNGITQNGITQNGITQNENVSRESSINLEDIHDIVNEMNNGNDDDSEILHLNVDDYSQGSNSVLSDSESVSTSINIILSKHESDITIKNIENDLSSSQSSSSSTLFEIPSSTEEEEWEAVNKKTEAKEEEEDSQSYEIVD